MQFVYFFRENCKQIRVRASAEIMYSWVGSSKEPIYAQENSFILIRKICRIDSGDNNNKLVDSKKSTQGRFFCYDLLPVQFTELAHQLRNIPVDIFLVRQYVYRYKLVT